jgi:hypothetical protein
MDKNSLFLIFLLFSILLSCKTDSSNNGIEEDAKLGDITLQVTGDAEAQKHFRNGLLLLHSFEYLDARSEFLKAQEIDKNFAMAYWGELMAYNHSIWQRQLSDMAKGALRKMGVTREVRKKMAVTEIEQDFLASVELLYGKGSKSERDQAYSDYLAKMVKKYPDNHEVLSFYALSLLATSKNGRDEKKFDKSAAIAQGILEENKNHPGALHYLIHSYDDPDHAHLAVDAADSYAKVAPDAAHALHMPSHIYVALGRWNDVVNSNIASWNASMKKLDRGQSKEGSYHALNWLQYGLLQRGETELATRLLKDMQKYTEARASKSARSYLLAMKGAHMVETNTWEGPIANIEILTKDLSLPKRTQEAFLEGMKAFHKGDEKQLASILDVLKKDKYKASLDVGNESFQMCSAGEYANIAPSQLDIDMVSIVEMELEAKLLYLQGKKSEALAILKKASDLDETLKYAFGPPIILKPVHEAYAEMLVAEGQKEEAFLAYKSSLERHPKRMLSVEGKLQLAKELGKTEDSNALENTLAEMQSEQSRKEVISKS